MATDRLCECGCGRQTPIATLTRTDRGWTHGEAKRFFPGHHFRATGPRLPRVAVAKRYRFVWVAKGKNMLIHRARAERALGKPLPKGAIVHHADGSRGDNAPLVICQDETYHKALHRRMRVQAAGGNPWTEKICSTCRLVKPRTAFGSNRRQPDGLCHSCRECARNYFLARKRGAA